MWTKIAIFFYINVLDGKWFYWMMILNSVRMASHSLFFDLDRTLIEMDQMSMPSDDSEPLADMLLVLLARNKLLECTYDIKNLFISMMLPNANFLFSAYFPFASHTECSNFLRSVLKLRQHSNTHPYQWFDQTSWPECIGVIVALELYLEFLFLFVFH